MPCHPIYTIGIQHLTPDDLFQAIAKYDIDCVVDIRSAGSPSLQSRLSADTLRRVFSEVGIAFLPFNNLLGIAPLSICDKRGNIIYDLAIECEPIAKGLSRLCTGLEKGYHILLIDESHEVVSTARFSVVGQYLTECGYLVYHIYSNGICLTHREIEEIEAGKTTRKLERKQRAAALGQWGELVATEYLSKNDYIILERNWNLHRGCELDIVALKDNVLHFVEVKTRSDNQPLPPQSAINLAKMRNLRRAISKYRAFKHIYNTPYQIDSIAIVHRSDTDFDLEHYEDIGMFVVR